MTEGMANACSFVYLLHTGFKDFFMFTNCSLLRNRLIGVIINILIYIEAIE